MASDNVNFGRMAISSYKQDDKNRKCCMFVEFDEKKKKKIV